MGEKIRYVFIERRERCVSRRDVVERGQREGEVVAGIRVAGFVSRGESVGERAVLGRFVSIVEG